jgi:oligopeptide transport system ATP-binding protein
MKKLETMISVRDLTVVFGTGKKKNRAVKGSSFDIYKGETFGLVGESGSGKTTVGRAIMGIQPLSDGTVYFDNRVIQGSAPNLYQLNLTIDKNLEKMKLNQATTTVRLHEYLNEFKRVYYKYTQSKFYDFKTKELNDYPDGKSRIISEGTNLKTTKLVTVKKNVNLNIVQEAVTDNLKRLLKIIRIQERTLKFTADISDYVELPKALDQTINEQEKELYQFVLLIKSLENQIYETLNEMQVIRQQVINGKYTSIKKFFTDLGQKVKLIIAKHKLITPMLDQAIGKHTINLALSAPARKKGEYQHQIENFLRLEDQKLSSAEIKKYQKILQVMKTNDFQEQIKKTELFKLPTPHEKRELKKKMQMIFQDPASSLNDRMAIQEIIGEGLDNFPELYKNPEAAKNYVDWYNENHTKNQQIKLEDVKAKDVKNFLILHLLLTVGMLPEHLSRYPHEFSGGQRQRIGIARALVMRPSFIVADEPISALDVSIRAQVMNLLAKFQKEFDLTYIFIAHDLSVVRFIANRIAVIYRGDIVEMAESDELFTNPLHPYTKSLLSAIPLPDPKQESKKIHYEYHPETEHTDYLVDFPQWVEIKPQHFVYANQRESQKYQKELKESK